VADALIARGHHVTILDDLSGGFRENVPAAAAFVQRQRGGITRWLTASSPMDRFDHVLPTSLRMPQKA
jgi:hypothetical protein